MTTPKSAAGPGLKLALVGTSHHRAPVEVRERVALDREAAGALARRLAGEGIEAVCLSTCNRTELYLGGAGVEARAEAALRELAGDAEPELVPALYRLRDGAAALHLFRVAAGLDSLVPGEGEILGQVRTAYEQGVTGPLLDRVFRQALHAGKKVRAHTAIAESPASVAAAAAALAQQVFGDLTGHRIVLVGAGKISEQAARNLVSRGAEIAQVANRTLDRAADLAAGLGAEALALDDLGQELERADVIVSSTSAPGVVLHRDDVAAALKGRRGRPLLLIDLAVPRDLDPGIHELDGCYLYDIDDLEAVVSESLTGRRREAERAEAIVAEEAERFREWQASLDVVPAIASLRARAEEIRAAELARVDARLSRLSETERRAVEAVTAQIVNKLLHLPTVRMKEAAVTADGVLYADAVKHLFGLGEEER
jgi:glutamyl-tRNA reductase